MGHHGLHKRAKNICLSIPSSWGTTSEKFTFEPQGNHLDPLWPQSVQALCGAVAGRSTGV